MQWRAIISSWVLHPLTFLRPRLAVTEGVPQYAGVIILSMSGIPLGFGRANHSTDQVRDLDPTAIAVLHQGDIGEYLRLETTE